MTRSRRSSCVPGTACAHSPQVRTVQILPRSSAPSDRLASREGDMMTTVLIATLTAIALYLAKRWSDSSAENSQLRSQVASLKRQLARRER